MQMRTQALARRRLPDELDRLLTVAPSSIWLIVVALTVAMAALVIWGFAGELPRRLSADGVLSSAQGLRIVQSESDRTGHVQQLMTRPGERVREGQPMLVLSSGFPARNASPHVVRAPSDGTLASLDVTLGEVVRRGTRLFALEPGDPAKEPPYALLFLAADKGAAITAGKKVDLSIASAPSAAFGVVRGRVESVSAYPASNTALAAMLGNADLAERFGRKGPPLVARVRLLPDRTTRSGLKWSTAKGAPYRLRPGSRVTANIIETEQTPVDAVFGKQ